MLEDPANCWTDVEHRLAVALPLLAAFRSFCQVDGAAAAAPFVFAEELGESPTGYAWRPEELERIAQYAIVTSAEQEAYRIARVTSDGFNASGTLVLLLNRLVPPEEEHAGATPRASRVQQDRKFKNRIGSIINELVDYWDATGGPWIREALVSDGPFHTHPDDREQLGHWQGAELVLAWGVRSE